MHQTATRGMQTRGRRREDECAQHKALFLNLAAESKSVLLELGSILNQRYRNRGPGQQTQSVLRRKNEAVSRLEQFISEQQRSCEREERSDQEDHQVTVERLEKQLQDQSAAFEQERVRLQLQATTTLNAQTDLSSSLNRMLPQLRGLLDAYDREQGQQDVTTRTVTITGQASSQDLTRRLTELQREFDKERAHLLNQASDAANTQQEISRKNLTEREAALTCPISLDLFENPVLTTCCGKTFSSEALTQALRRNHQCPVCRAYRISTHANLDMANLVELHRTERSVLGLPENVASNSTTVASDATDRSVVEERPNAASDRGRELVTSAAREHPHRNQRNQRVQARSEVPHRQPSRTATQSSATANSTPPNAGVSTGIRGRRRGGRGSSSCRRRTSRSSASSTTTATSQAPHHVISRNDTMPSPVQSLSWRTSNAASQSSMASAAPSTAGSGVSGNGWAQGGRPIAASYSNRGSLLDPLFPLRSSSNADPLQSSNSIRYGRAPTDAEFNYYPHAGMGYYDSNSDSDYMY